jgi:phage FluMu gp28-like protein
MNSQALMLPYQAAWLHDRSQVKVCEKSRRVGLSWADAADSALTAAATAGAGGMDCWYIGYNKDMAQEYIRDCADWARAFDQAAVHIDEEVLNDEGKDILTFVIKFASGFRVTALSSRPSNLRGKQGKVTIDEAAFHDQLKALLKAAMALLIWGGRVCVISTHNGEENEFNELVLEIRAGKKAYSLHRIEFRQAVAAGLYQRICKVTGREWTQSGEAAWVQEMYDFYGESATEELDVVPSSGSGVYLTRALIEGVMDAAIPVVRWRQPGSFAEVAKHQREAECLDWCDERLAPLLEQLDPRLLHFFGSDFARSGDLSCIWPIARTPLLTCRTPFVVELGNIPFEQQRQVLFYIVDRLPRFSGGALDARGNGQYLAEVAMQRYGSARIAQVMLSTEWYRENMPAFKAAFEDKTVNAPRDADILTDLRSVKTERGIAKVPDSYKTRGTDGNQRHGDSAIALALAVYAERALEAAPIEFQSAGTRDSTRAFSGAEQIGFMAGRERVSGFGSVAGGNDFNGYV